MCEHEPRRREVLITDEESARQKEWHQPDTVEFKIVYLSANDIYTVNAVDGMGGLAKANTLLKQLRKEYEAEGQGRETKRREEGKSSKLCPR